MLTQRTNGSGSSNLISAQWWNDYYQLLTGSMSDQPVTIKANVVHQVIAGAPTAPTATTTSGSGPGLGTYQYVVTWVTADGGETLPSSSVSVTVSGTSTGIPVLTIPTGPVGTVARKIYRTHANASSPFYLLTTVNDNTTTTYNDTNFDSLLSLFLVAPTHSSFGGSLVFLDQNGNVMHVMTLDGTRLGNEGVQAFSGAPVVSTVPNITSGGSLGVGAYKWVVTYGAIDGGETVASSQLTATTTSGNQTAVLTIPVGPPGTLARNIYRTQVGGSTLCFLARVSNNTATTYTDTASDAVLNLSKQPPSHPTFGGTLRFSDQNKNNTSTMSMDGADLVFQPNSTGGAFFIESNNAANVSILKCRSGLGVESSTGSKLAEFKGSGNMVIQGNTYFSNGQTPVLNSGSFDGFDIGETYQADMEYPAGTVLCPADTTTPIPYVIQDLQYGAPVLTQCTHDGCNLAHVVTKVPGFSMGVANVPSSGPDYYDPNRPLTQCMALSGRVFCKTANDIPGRSYVTSDGRGGVRQVMPGEQVMALGVSLAPTDQGMIPVSIRPMFVSL